MTQAQAEAQQSAATPQQLSDTAEAAKEVKSWLDKAVEYKPLGQSETVKLTADQVKNFLSVHTKSGVAPSKQDIVKFMMLCKARGLDPWVGDAELVGYDSRDGAKFSLITTQQAFYTRAESHEQYDGLESGLIVVRGKGDKQERLEFEGEVCLPGDVVIGAWCKVYRKDRSRPTRRDVNLKSYQKPTAIWQSNPYGMLTKCARCGSLREAFPTAVGDLYVEGEIDASVADSPVERPSNGKSPLKALTETMTRSSEEIPVGPGSGYDEPVMGEVADVKDLPPEDREFQVDAEADALRELYAECKTTQAVEAAYKTWAEAVFEDNKQLNQHLADEAFNRVKPAKKSGKAAAQGELI